ncbi:NAD(P)/FAD-dependent oxidoreductase [Paracoccus pacificus]|uniref:NAD(P)/FAD-dependent oxidoreductase n=1 Tax=Paracoccus pacificus TaxID=1463598 RepID=A0ABW4R3A9_9RHOB
MTADFLIIGGGIAGISAAASLAQHGAVTLLEGEPQLAYHASGRSAAMYEPNYGPAPIKTLSHASAAALRSLGVLSPRGFLLVARPDQETEFRAEIAKLDLMETTIADACAWFPALNPEKLGFAAKGEMALDIDTDMLIQIYLRQAREQGAQILTSQPVIGIAREGGIWTAETTGGDFRGRTLINAAGAWADPVARMAEIATLNIIPHRRSMARIPAPEGMDPARWPMLHGIGTNSEWYAKPDAGALIVSPSEADPTEPHDAWADDMILAEGLARYEAMTRFPITRMLANWAGLRSFAPDGSPVYGRDPDQPDFVWYAGQGGYGFQSAPGGAAFLADLLIGRPVDPVLAAAVSPARFR